MIDHVSLQVADLDASVAFYTDVFAPIGLREVMRHEQHVGLGDDFPFFWLSPAPGAETREVHLALRASAREQVDAVHAAAVARGVEVLNAPRVWPEYHPGYYGVFLRDLDGHNVEAVFHDMSAQSG